MARNRLAIVSAFALLFWAAAMIHCFNEQALAHCHEDGNTHHHSEAKGEHHHGDSTPVGHLPSDEHPDLCQLPCLRSGMLSLPVVLLGLGVIGAPTPAAVVVPAAVLVLDTDPRGPPDTSDICFSTLLDSLQSAPNAPPANLL